MGKKTKHNPPNPIIRTPRAPPGVCPDVTHVTSSAALNSLPRPTPLEPLWLAM